MLTGAGVSAPSGIPTFRGDEGLWRRHRAEDLATPEGFARDPRLVWEWYDWRRGLIAAAEPNAAHHVSLRRLTLHSSLRRTSTACTSAGADVLRSPRLLDLARVAKWRCVLARCATGKIYRANRAAAPCPAPYCVAASQARAGSASRFDTGRVRIVAYEAAASCEVFLIIGTSAQVQPAASLWEHARRAGAFVIEINPTRTVASDDVDVSIQADAAHALASIDAALGAAADA